MLLHEKTHIIHVQSTLNNTIITLTDSLGNALYWASSGTAGFKNSRKSTSYAAQAAAEKVAQYCITNNAKKVNVEFKGLGSFACKESSLKGFQIYGLHIKQIQDKTSFPHNGCRLPKKRRL